MLDIRWLEDLKAVAATQSFTRAAALRNLTQPGLSRRIQKLEHWAGAPLIDRNLSPTALTEAGRELVSVSDDFLPRLHQFRHGLSVRKAEEGNLLRFAAPHILSTTFFPEWFPKVISEFGHGGPVVVSQHLQVCFESLERCDVQFVICLVDAAGHTFFRLPERYRPYPALTIKIGDERLVPVSGVDQYGQARHSLGEGKDTPYLRYTSECSLGWAVDANVAGWNHVSLVVKGENSFADGLRLMVKSGLGVSWLPMSSVAQDLASGELVRAGTSDHDVEMGVVVVRQSFALSKRAEAFWRGLGQSKAMPNPKGKPMLRAVR